mmetsp:Transcript_4282/g.9397  ORF Transcript_4282/g.9397 Transcript_4282/m.9397 type:complete len:210 (-) Transcript_4282:142-771(-)
MVTTAEIVSTIGVIKRHYGFFAFENTIWLVMFLAVLISSLRCRWVAHSTFDPTERPSLLVACRMLGCFLSLGLVLYNVLIDVPMYIRLYRDTISQPGYNLALYEGMVHGLRCQQMLSIDDKTWREYMLWMSLNYLALPTWMNYICAITGRHRVRGHNEAGKWSQGIYLAAILAGATIIVAALASNLPDEYSWFASHIASLLRAQVAHIL